MPGPCEARAQQIAVEAPRHLLGLRGGLAAEARVLGSREHPLADTVQTPLLLARLAQLALGLPDRRLRVRQLAAEAGQDRGLLLTQGGDDLVRGLGEDLDGGPESLDVRLLGRVALAQVGAPVLDLGAGPGRVLAGEVVLAVLGSPAAIERGDLVDALLSTGAEPLHLPAKVVELRAQPLGDPIRCRRVAAQPLQRLALGEGLRLAGQL